ncbi:MAG: hypothetical protein PHS98_04180 [Bacilli bacterium]|nr:hypothetical protein [Bacilli bacterium]MDD4643847.1 hypothetical protein [Bacilli bacterium]
MRKDLKDELTEIDVKMVATILIFISAILFIVAFLIQKEQVIDKKKGLYYYKNYPNDDEYIKIAFFILLIANIIFLYYGYKNLQTTQERYKKTSNQAGLSSAYSYFYGRIIQIIGVILIIYSLYISSDKDVMLR